MIQWRISKNGNSALRTCHFGKCLLTVAGDEQQEVVSKTFCILTETGHIFYILTWWIGAFTYKEYVPKDEPQK